MALDEMELTPELTGATSAPAACPAHGEPDTHGAIAVPGAPGTCPVDHGAWARRKTGRPAARSALDRGTEGHDLAPIARDADGVWHVRGFEEARAILRGSDTKQAGFKAELIERMSAPASPPTDALEASKPTNATDVTNATDATGISGAPDVAGASKPRRVRLTPRGRNTPILYQEGKPHQQQRKQTARFFAPVTVSTRYRVLMERLADQLVLTLQRRKRADLSRLTMTLAVRVAGEVVGLTESRLPGMDRRLDAFFSDEGAATGGRLARLTRALQVPLRMAAFYYLDVRPAIRARRRQPREDVISHLLAQGYGDAEILTECVTYAAAGMVTTREFIGAAAWHLLERPDLRARYLVAPEEERQALLHEALRLEPVVGHLYRRTTADVTIESAGQPVTIPSGALLDIHVDAANADPRVVDAPMDALVPGRTLRADRTTPALLSFGDGHHRCPGAYIAIQETDIFLRRLLALDGLRIVRGPALTWNDLVTGYELRDFIVAVD